MASEAEWLERDVDGLVDDKLLCFADYKVQAIYWYSQDPDGTQTPLWHEVPYLLLAGWVEGYPMSSGGPAELPINVLNSSKLVTLGHQTSGHSCRYVGFIGWKVEIKPSFRPFSDQLVSDYYHSCIEFDDLHEETIVDYERRLSGTGLSANCIRGANAVPLTEGVYPFDFNHEAVSLVAADPQAVRTQMKLLAPWAKPDSLNFFLIAKNSD